MSAEESPVRVEAYAGARYPERPLRVEWQGVMREVIEIERQWQEPERRCFVLTLEGDTRLRLCYYFRHDAWSASELGGSAT
ncbi:MAG: hypothetical protein HYS09_05960 [Chloroflexi bacterium]|nr:hypothetical protein [Chloroflexota bacterium]